jgi:predicted CXXCH cytochrome family protein
MTGRRFHHNSSSIPCFILLVFLGLVCRVTLAQVTVPPNAGKDCAVCHLEWVSSFKESAGIVLLEAPQKPLVAESDTCLGCHDGSVSDSRRQVWLEHGHRTGIEPVKGMKVPSELPLDSGKLACRTCHTAHVAGFNESLKDAVFLRVRNEQDQLCKTCHADKTGGADVGSHPLVAMKQAFPPALTAAGAHSGPKNDQVLCQSCHTAHGSKEDKLLLMATNASQLCVSCHETMRPAMWDTDPTHNHPQNPPIHKASQLKAIKEMGTQLGADNHLVCLSCHKMHNGHSGKAMLADTLIDSALCIRCHEERKPMLGTAHDLRKTAPNELNIRGETPGQTGLCGACHTFHTYMRKATPTPADPQGLCVTCHSEGQVAAKHSSTLFHPVDLGPDRVPKNNTLLLTPSTKDPNRKALTCMSCHDPHDSKHPNLLRLPSEQTCANCHSDLSTSLAKPHDFTGQKEIKNALGHTADDVGRCAFCHSVHEAKGQMMLAATKDPIKTMDDGCIQCHKPDAMARKHPVAKFNHPSGPMVKSKAPLADLKLGVSLFDADFHTSATGSVSCSSCHNVHVGEKQSKALLRTSTTTELCIQCHSSEAKMAGSQHDVKVCKKPFPAEAAKSNDLCLSCHRSHGNDLDRRLWTITPTKGQNADDGACLVCHADQAWSLANRADHAGLTLHPQAILASSAISKIKHSLPLIESKELSSKSSATLACKTCHEPHAPPKITALLRISIGQSAVDVCAKCHVEADDIKTSMHRPLEMANHKLEDHACAPCHQVHTTDGMERKHLWAANVFAKGENESEKLCLSCHSSTGGASIPAISSHPVTNLKDIRKATTRPSSLVDQFGQVSQITCNTCHLSHGRHADAKIDLRASRGRAEVASLKTMLRPNVDREFCAACHGIDGAKLYLYFHDPKKRRVAK